MRSSSYIGKSDCNLEIHGYFISVLSSGVENKRTTKCAHSILVLTLADCNKFQVCYE